MLKFLKRLADGLRGTPAQDQALEWLKARYHIFRILLADNERALDLLAGVDRLSREDPRALGPAVDELLETLHDLADGLNRLSDSAHLGLYGRFAQLRKELAKAVDSAAAGGAVCVPLRDLAPGMERLAGGKAQRLGELRRAGLPVPDGFAVPVDACARFLDEARITGRAKGLLHGAIHNGAAGNALPEAAARIRTMILAAQLPSWLRRELESAWLWLAGDNGTAVSVRSSALGEDTSEHSFAGQYTSVLNVVDAVGLEAAFKEVLASAFGARVVAYRQSAGLPPDELDMAVLCQRMVRAKASGVLFTVDPTAPGQGRMLLTAVAGLGTVAVSGESPADTYRPARALDDPDPRAEIAVKTVQDVPAARGGLARVHVAEGHAPLLTDGQVRELATLGARIEALQGGPQDIEWALDQSGRLRILQARPARLSEAAPAHTAGRGALLLGGGVPASPGVAAGRVAVIHTRDDLAALDGSGGPAVLVLHQSLVDAAAAVPQAAAVLVDMGNPLDHLSCLAREWSRPMLTGLGTATTALHGGQWVLVDGQRGNVHGTDAALWQDQVQDPARSGRKSRRNAALRELVLPLNLTDAYGPTFNAAECRTAHDIIRFVHEKAILGMFRTGDAVAEGAWDLVRRLEDAGPLHFMLLDLGGGLAPDSPARQVRLEHVLSGPLLALCRGMATPGLRWNKPPPLPGLTGLMGNAMLDKRGERPVGEPNYALVSRDYLNLNARVDYHFAMVDAVCGHNPRENSVRFRFKGGGTTRVQRERRAAFVEQVLSGEDFYANRQGDLVTGLFSEGPQDVVREKLVMLGRFLGFSRLLDAAMTDDNMPRLLAEAFRAGDFGLEELGKRLEIAGGEGGTF